MSNIIKTFETFSNFIKRDIVTISDLISMMSKLDPNNIITAINFDLFSKNPDGKSYYFITDFIKIDPNKYLDSIYSNEKYYTSEYDIYTTNIEYDDNNLMSIDYVGNKDVEIDYNSETPKYKTIGQLIDILKTIENPDKSLFFIRTGAGSFYSHAGSNNTNTYAIPMTIGNKSLEVYSFRYNDKLIGFNQHVNMFMDKSKEQFVLMDVDKKD